MSEKLKNDLYLWKEGRVGIRIHLEVAYYLQWLVWWPSPCTSLVLLFAISKYKSPHQFS
jgi:hypothetical protein